MMRLEREGKNGDTKTSIDLNVPKQFIIERANPNNLFHKSNEISQRKMTQQTSRIPITLSS